MKLNRRINSDFLVEIIVQKERRKNKLFAVQKQNNFLSWLMVTS